MGRPRGKKSDPALSHVTIYIRKSAHQEAKKRLFPEQREFNGLMEELPAKWVQTSGNPETHNAIGLLSLHAGGKGGP